MEDIEIFHFPLALLQRPQGGQVLPNGGGGIHHHQGVVVAGVPREEVPALRVQIAHGALGVARHLQNLQGAAAQVQLVPGPNGTARYRAVWDKVSLLGEGRDPHLLQLALYIADPGGQGLLRQHGHIQGVDIAAAKFKHPSHMVHVAVGGGHFYGQVRQGCHKVLQAPQAGHGVDEQGLFPALH